MIIKVLAENTSSAKNLGCEHGLSLYIETKSHKLLFDTGTSDLFYQNAAKMNVDLTAVDLAVISHGHNDHGGGLKTFLDLNSKARVYLHEKAFESHYAARSNGEKEYIGLEQTLLPDRRFVFCGDSCIIDEELELLSGIKATRLLPSGNATLLIKTGDKFLQDDFGHEQNLVIRENGKTILIAGCAHCGIVNIVEQFHKEKGCLPDLVIGGFHLFNNGTKESENPAIIKEIAEFLINSDSMYYTCHCTGIEPYNQLKSLMGKKLAYLSTGSQIEI